MLFSCRRGITELETIRALGEIISIVDSLDKLLHDKREHAISRQAYDNARDQREDIPVSLDYHGKYWDFAIAKPNKYLRLFGRDEQGFVAIETCWRDPQTAGPIEKQKAELLEAWTRLANREPEFRSLKPPLAKADFRECQSDADLILKLAQAPHARGKAIFIDDMCFISTGPTPEHEWLAFKGRFLRGRMPLIPCLREAGADVFQQILETMRASEPAPIGRAP